MIPKIVVPQSRDASGFSKSRSEERVLRGERGPRLCSVPVVSEPYYVKANSNSGSRHHACAGLGTHFSLRWAAVEEGFLLDTFLIFTGLGFNYIAFSLLGILIQVTSHDKACHPCLMSAGVGVSQETWKWPSCKVPCVTTGFLLLH